MSKVEFAELQRQVLALTEALARMTGDHSAQTFGEFATSYQTLKLCSPSLREATKRSFEYQLRCHLIPAFGHLPIDKLGAIEWLTWVAETRAKPKGESITRFFNVRKALMEILNAAKEEGHLTKIPKIENPDEARDVGRALSDSEMFKILRHCRRPFFRFFFFTLMKQGCRPREILQWEWSMIRWGEPGKTWIDIPARISKCDRSRPVPLNPSVSRRLYAEFQRGPTSRFVFPDRKDPSKPQLSYHGAWKTACMRARVKATVPYDTRRTFITNAVADGEVPLYVAKILDTSVKQIESRYAKNQIDVMERIVK